MSFIFFLLSIFEVSFLEAQTQQTASANNKEESLKNTSKTQKTALEIKPEDSHAQTPKIKHSNKQNNIPQTDNTPTDNKNISQTDNINKIKNNVLQTNSKNNKTLQIENANKTRAENLPIKQTDNENSNSLQNRNANKKEDNILQTDNANKENKTTFQKDTANKNNVREKTSTATTESDKSSQENIDVNSKNPSPFVMELETEGQFIKNSLSKNQKNFYPNIPYGELSFKYSFSSKLDLFTQLEFVSQHNLWDVTVEQLGLSYQNPYFTLKAGLMPLPLGYAYKNLKEFIQPLHLYSFFIVNQMDTGLIFEIPLIKDYLSIEGSRFKGYLKRNSDNYYKPPEFAPLIFSLKSKGPSWNGFVTWLKQDFAFLESLNAFGGGFSLQTSFLKDRFTGFLQGEVWGSKEENQSSLSYYLFPKLKFKEWALSAVFGEIMHFSPDFYNAKVKTSSLEGVLQASYEFYPGFILIAERLITKQKEGPLINSLWGARLKIHKEF